MIGGPSKYLRDQKNWFKWTSVDWMLGMFFAYSVYLIVNFFFKANTYMPTVLAIIMLFIYKTFNKQAWKSLYKALNYRQGMDGEATVYEELKKLPEDYVVIQDVKIPNEKTNIDFVVLGANGIWAIEVKSHKGEITYDGKQLLRNGYRLEKNFLWQARAESKALTEYLQANVDRSLYANPILVFSSPNTFVKLGRVPIEGIMVINVNWLIEQITKNISPINVSKDYIKQVVNHLILLLPNSALN